MYGYNYIMAAPMPTSFDTFSMQSVLSMNLLNSYRTGNQIADMVLGMIIVASLKYVFQFLAWLGQWVYKNVTLYGNQLWAHWFGPKSLKYYTLVVNSKHEGISTEYSMVPSNVLINAVVSHIIDTYPQKIDTVTLAVTDYSTDKSTPYRAFKTRKMVDRLDTFVLDLIYKNTKIHLILVTNPDNKELVKNTHTITLKSTLPLEDLKEWVNQCYNQYIDKYYKDAALTELRYYMPNGSNRTFSEFDLNNEKSFDQLFFEEKETCLQQVDAFINKTGIYGTNKIPYRLNILLYGPPGSGKSSFIKALANYTQRSVINIDLSTVTDYLDLLRILHMKQIFNGSNSCYVPLNKRIYILEDIDCQSNNVNNRANTNADNVANTTNAPKKIHLSGILNSLDGVVELKDTIIIMTTNHIDKLDPALIRPGRINIRVLLDRMKLPYVAQLLKYHYNEIISEKRLRQSGLFDKKYTPAELEGVIINCPTCTEFLTKIKTVEPIA